MHCVLRVIRCYVVICERECQRAGVESNRAFRKVIQRSSNWAPARVSARVQLSDCRIAQLSGCILCGCTITHYKVRKSPTTRGSESRRSREEANRGRKRIANHDGVPIVDHSRRHATLCREREREQREIRDAHLQHHLLDDTHTQMAPEYRIANAITLLVSPYFTSVFGFVDDNRELIQFTLSQRIVCCVLTHQQTTNIYVHENTFYQHTITPNINWPSANLHKHSILKSLHSNSPTLLHHQPRQ